MRFLFFENKGDFVGLNTSEKVKVVRQAFDRATKEQLDIVNKHGGISSPRSSYGGGVFVHEYRSISDSSFSVLVQDFIIKSHKVFIKKT